MIRMSWLVVLKAIPASGEMVNYLQLGDAGIDRLALEFERALESGEAKNLRSSKKKIEEFAAGETGDLPPEIAEKVNEHAKKLKAILDEMFEGRDAQGKVFKPTPRNEPKITDELLAEAISEYSDGKKEKLIDWLGENKENRHSKKRQKILKDNRGAIRRLPQDDDDLFYVTFRKGTMYVTEPSIDIDDTRQAFSEIEGLKFREDMDDSEKENDPFNQLPGVTIFPPQKMSKSEYTKFENAIEKLKADNKSVYKLKGKKIPSVLWSVVGNELSADETRAKEKFEKDGKVAYRSNVTTAKQVLDYFELLTNKGWVNKTIFMPDSILSQKKDSQAMKTIIGGGKSGGWGEKATVSNELKTVLQSPTFDPAKMAEISESEKLMIPLQLRTLIAGEDLSEETKELIKRAGITTDALKELRDKAQTTGSDKYIDWPKFQKLIRSRNNQTLNESFKKLQGAMGGVMENLFNEEEVKFFEGLKGKSEDEVEDSIAEFYNVDEDTVLDSDVTVPTRRILRANNIFTQTPAGFKLDSDHAYKDRDTFTRVFRTFRQNKYSIDISGKSEIGGFKGIKNTGILELIMDIDFYYYRKLVDGYYDILNEDNEDAQEELWIELLPTLQKEYPNIIQALIDATDNKMKLIIDNREDYIKAMKLKIKRKDNQRYGILNKLLERNLIVKIGSDEVE
tara:strand:- start:790 stop:2826 length:2037 start_codon:yes stop_codon:yes gene_type:complete